MASDTTLVELVKREKFVAFLIVFPLLASLCPVPEILYRRSFLLLLHIVDGYFLGNILHELYLFFKERKGLASTYKKSILRCLGFVFFWDVPCIFFSGILTARCVDGLRQEPAFPSMRTVICAAACIALYRSVVMLPRVALQSLREEYNLNVGYLSASYYYFNYLKNFIPNEFLERVRHFRTEQEVDVIEKLFIMVPISCHIKQYLDDTHQIERARELLPYTLNIAGVYKREYNITVYQLFRNQDYDCYWCCVEYAQPLRQLWELKCSRKVTENEMHQEYLHFVQTLYSLLHDEHDSYRTCILLCYDDTNPGVVEAEVLLQACDVADT